MDKLLINYEICIRFDRWVRFEEDIEENGKRWSKPYVPSMPLSSFIEFRQCFANGMVALDVPGNSLEDILGKLNISKDFFVKIR